MGEIEVKIPKIMTEGIAKYEERQAQRFQCTRESYLKNPVTLPKDLSSRR